MRLEGPRPCDLGWGVSDQIKVPTAKGRPAALFIICEATGLNLPGTATRTGQGNEAERKDTQPQHEDIRASLVGHLKQYREEGCQASGREEVSTVILPGNVKQE